MSNWNVRVVEDDNEASAFSILFKRAFPRRSISFFSGILSSLSEHRGNLIILESHDKKPIGGVIFFKVDGYDMDCWAPSYFFVLKKYRKLSIPFLIKAQNCFSGKILNVTPSDDMCSILDALKFKSFTQGSKVIINFNKSLSLFKKYHINKHPVKKIMLSKNNIDINFFYRKDLNWMSTIYMNKEVLLCFKKTSWFGLPLQILVYSKGTYNKNICSIISKIDTSSLGLSVIIYPKTIKSSFKHNLIGKKFRVYGNFDNADALYSILGSEVTEIL